MACASTEGRGQGERRPQRSAAIDDYERGAGPPQAGEAVEVLSCPRRELRDQLGAKRRTFAPSLAARSSTGIERSAKSAPGRRGATCARRVTGFFDWLANRWRDLRSRRWPATASRAAPAPQMVEQPGRALDDDGDRGAVACDRRRRFGTLVRVCLLTGARRGEAAAMEWDDLDLEVRPVG